MKMYNSALQSSEEKKSLAFFFLCRLVLLGVAIFISISTCSELICLSILSKCFEIGRIIVAPSKTGFFVSVFLSLIAFSLEAMRLSIACNGDLLNTVWGNDLRRGGKSSLEKLNCFLFSKTELKSNCFPKSVRWIPSLEI